jgi:hypothetical protein
MPLSASSSSREIREGVSAVFQISSEHLSWESAFFVLGFDEAHRIEFSPITKNELKSAKLA